MLVLCLAGPPAASAQSFYDQFRGEDGWFDASDWVLNNAVGFMPVPIIITEPAVGQGLGLAALFFHPPKGYSQEEFEAQRERRQSDGDSSEFVLPDITAVAGAKTSNGSWLVGGGHFAHWKDDRVRYQGLIGYASVNLAFFGLDQQVFPNGISFNLEGLLLDQPISFRVRDSNFFVGARYMYSKIKTRLDLRPGDPDLTFLNLEPALSALGAFVTYDSRDTIFTPSTGMEAEIGLRKNDAAIGSDFDFDLWSGELHKYWQTTDTLVLGLRLDAEYATGDVPFYAVPFISLRGIPAMRYQGKSIAVAEGEARWAFHPRVSAVGFLGYGKAADSWSNIGSAPSRTTQGLGLRYFMARKLGMHAGIDVAKGPEDTYFYLTMGSAW